MARSLIAIIFVIVGSLSVMHSGARAFETKGQLEPVLETRAKGLFEELRCVVCQNQSIGGSNADVAKDLRNIVRQQITLGKTDDQIRAFLVARYGEFILLKPNFGYHTALLWGAPLLILLLGLGLIVYFRPQLNKQPEPALSEAEESELADLLKARSKD